MAINVLLLRDPADDVVRALGTALVAALLDQPTSTYRRRAWFLFETFTPFKLPIPDLRTGNYAPLLDPRRYVTGPVSKHRRYRLDVNLLGTPMFAPSVRRTAAIDAVDSAQLQARIHDVVGAYDDAMLRRAISYLYAKETRATFAIEREKPSPDRTERFVVRLKDAPKVPRLWKKLLVRLQNTLVEERYRERGWRTEQVYIGSGEVLHLPPTIHAVFPKPEDIEELMEGYLEAARRLQQADDVDPVVSAAVVAFGFVLLHPFEDGNGRIHRWIIHWFLVNAGVTPEHLIVPVSAVMLNRREEYEDVLGAFSSPLLSLIDYTLNADDHSMKVHGDTADHYRFPDVTDMAAGLWRWLESAVDESLVNELGYLQRFDTAIQAARAVVDMPDRRLHVFIKAVVENARLTKKKRKFFRELSDEEAAKMELEVLRAFKALKGHA